MGVVSQEPVLFNDTSKENIVYNRFHTTRKEVIAPLPTRAILTPKPEVRGRSHSPKEK
jgi:ABC-type transport system involved in Fe-S cluster assembly fused permease/ATPase subunit